MVSSFCSSSHSRLVSFSYEPPFFGKSFTTAFTVSLACIWTTWLLFCTGNLCELHQWHIQAVQYPPLVYERAARHLCTICDMCFHLTFYLTLVVDSTTACRCWVHSFLCACIYVWENTVFHCSDKYQFQCTNMNTSSKEKVRINDISSMLANDNL